MLMFKPIPGFQPRTFHSRPLSATVAAIALLLVSVCCQCGAAPNNQSDARTETSEGIQAFERGAFDQAISHWQQAAEFYHTLHDSRGEIDSMVRLATAHEALGQ